MPSNNNKNRVSTTLSTNVNTAEADAPVVSTADFPQTGTFVVLIDNEIIEAEVDTSTNLKLTNRGRDGTTDTNHLASATVTLIVAKYNLDTLLWDDYSDHDKFASKLGCGGWEFSDSQTFFKYNGSSYDYYGLLWPMLPPQDTAMNWTNQDACTITETKGPSVLNAVGAVASVSIRIRRKTAPTQPYVLRLFCNCNSVGTTYNVGMLRRDTTDTRLVTFGLSHVSGNQTIAVQRWSNENTFTSTEFSIAASLLPGIFNGAGFWLEWENDSTDVYYRIGTSREKMTLLYSHAKNTYATGNQVGFYCNNQNSSNVPMQAIFWNWDER